MFCSKCGNQVPLDSQFCNKCGEKVVKDNNQNIESQINNGSNKQVNNAVINNMHANTSGYNQISNKKNNNKNIIIIIACIIGVILITIIGYNVFNQIRLHIIDNKIQEEAEKLGDIDDFDTDKTTNNSSNQKRTYEVGDAIKLVDGSSWHVIRQETNGQIVLLSDVLVKDSSPYGSDASEASQRYANSIVKQYIEETYLPLLKQSLLNNNGDISNLSARLITADEYLKLTGDNFSDDYMYSMLNFSRTEEQEKNRKWLSLTTSFWTASNIREYTNSDWYSSYSIFVTNSATSLHADYAAKNNAQSFIGSVYGIRPVIETSIKNIQ